MKKSLHYAGFGALFFAPLALVSSCGEAAPAAQETAAPLRVLAAPRRKTAAPATIETRLVTAARKQIGTCYTQEYFVLKYPNGDPPRALGACTDVIIRALRPIGYDLQKMMHDDMTRHFNLYPRQWGLRRTDKNIDHRRVPNQRVFMARFAKKLTREVSPRTLSQWQPGDFVYWKLDGGIDHCGVVSDRRAPDGHAAGDSQSRRLPRRKRADCVANRRSLSLSQTLKTAPRVLAQSSRNFTFPYAVFTNSVWRSRVLAGKSRRRRMNRTENRMGGSDKKTWGESHMKRTVQHVVTGLALLSAVSAVALSSAPAQAQTTTPTPTQHHWNRTINGRQTHQQKRIFQGVHSGDLTNREAGHLERRETHAARLERRDRRDGGTFTRRERLNSQRRLNRISHDIHHQKHDAQDRD